jgi:hypothetical protein
MVTNLQQCSSKTLSLSRSPVGYREVGFKVKYTKRRHGQHTTFAALLFEKPPQPLHTNCMHIVITQQFSVSLIFIDSK